MTDRPIRAGRPFLGRSAVSFSTASRIENAMPIYDYDCQACGPFTAIRSMAEFRDPFACPSCGVGAPRAALSAPCIASMDPTRRSALASNERNAGSQRSTKAAHPAGCGCCMRRWPVPSALSSNSGRVFSSSGQLRRSGR